MRKPAQEFVWLAGHLIVKREAIQGVMVDNDTLYVIMQGQLLRVSSDISKESMMNMIQKVHDYVLMPC